MTRVNAYYNEFDEYAAQWLRNLIAAGHIAPGLVDERSIKDVRPQDLAGFTQCHFFAGIGVWSYALRLAGWPDDRPVWTGSCPCQPFSTAGKGKGFADERHLWPEFYRLIRECQPGVVLGEQVASKDGLAWLDTVCANMEGAGYAIGAVDLCAAGVGAPHIRQRLFFGAVALGPTHGGLGHGLGAGLQGWIGMSGRSDQRAAGPSGLAGGLADSDGGLARDGAIQRRRQHRCEPQDGEAGGLVEGADPAGTGTTDGVWRDPDWLLCRDDRWRPVEPGTFPLADGAPARVGRLRAYGNAIVAQAAAEVISAFMECRP